MFLMEYDGLNSLFKIMEVQIVECVYVIDKIM